jgi:hypothetical protein
MFDRKFRPGYLSIFLTCGFCKDYCS